MDHWQGSMWGEGGGGVCALGKGGDVSGALESMKTEEGTVYGKRWVELKLKARD